MTTSGKTTIRIDKSARLVILLELDNRGLLDGSISYQEIANLFAPNAPNRSTIFRDVQQLPKLRATLHRIEKRIDQMVAGVDA